MHKWLARRVDRPTTELLKIKHITPFGDKKTETMTPEEKELLSKAISKYGINPQCDQATEEMAELIQAINKCRRNKIILSSHIQGKSILTAEQALIYDNLLSEIVDVEIMLDQLKIMFDIHNKALPLIRERKLERLRNNLNKN